MAFEHVGINEGHTNEKKQGVLKGVSYHDFCLLETPRQAEKLGKFYSGKSFIYVPVGGMLVW